MLLSNMMIFSETSIVDDDPLKKYSKAGRYGNSRSSLKKNILNDLSSSYHQVDLEMNIVSFKESHTGIEKDQHYTPYPTYQSFNLEDLSSKEPQNISSKIAYSIF